LLNPSAHSYTSAACAPRLSFAHYYRLNGHFAVTRERIRQIEAKALRKLRHPSRSRKLRAFMDGTRD